MKKGLIIILVLIIVLVASFITNPSKDHFTSWLANKMEERYQSENPSEIESKISDYLTQYLGKNLLEIATTHYDYKLYSIYKVKMIDKELRFIGIFNSFILLSQK